MFEQNIVHGALIAIFFLNKVVIAKEYFKNEININFLKHAEYLIYSLVIRSAILIIVFSIYQTILGFCRNKTMNF